MAEMLYILKNGQTEEAVGNYWAWESDSELPITFGSDDSVVYSEYGPVRAYTKKFEYVDQLMGERYVTVTISSPYPIHWEKGDWCVVHGEKMTLRYIPTGKKQARKNAYGEAYIYENVKLTSITGDMSTRYFQDYVTGDTVRYYTALTAFTFYVEKIQDIADRIQANLDVNYPDEWIVQVKESTDESCSWKKQSVSISEGTTILSALALVNSTFNQNYVVETLHTGDEVVNNLTVQKLVLKGKVKEEDGKYILEEDMKVITIGGDASVMPSELCYGIGKGLRNVEVQTQPNEVAVTRLRAVGSTRNLPYRYYNKHYRKKYPNGTKVYPMFWDGDTYLLEAGYYPNLMLPMAYWNQVQLSSNEKLFNVYVDAIRQNYLSASTAEGDIMYEKAQEAPVSLEDDNIFEGYRKFDTDDADYDECYPTLEEMTIDNTWANGNIYAYLTGYQTRYTLGYQPTLNSLCLYLVNKGFSNTFTVQLISAPDSFKQGDLTDDQVKYYVIGRNYQAYISNKVESSLSNAKESLVSELIQKIVHNDTTNMWECNEDNVKLSYSFTDLIKVETSRRAHSSSTVIYSGWYKYKYSVAVTIDTEELQQILQTSYIDAGGYMDETTQYLEPITTTLVNSIIANTYNESGRLDKIIGKSIVPNTDTNTSSPGSTSSSSSSSSSTLTDLSNNSTGFGGRRVYKAVGGTGIQDNGIPEDGDFSVEAVDTDGVIMEQSFQVSIPQICFNITDWVNDSPKLVMKTGACAGREFDISSCVCVDADDYSKGWKLILSRYYDTTVNMVFPNKNAMIEEGDEYVITGINMPDIYVDAAEAKLFKNAMKYLSNVDDVSRTYNVELDNKWLAENYSTYTKYLNSGKKFIFSDSDYDRRTGIWNEDKDLGLGSIAVLIKQVSIKYGYNPIPQYEITLDNDAETVSIQSAIAEKVNSVRTDFNTVVGSMANTINNALSKTEDDTATGTITFNSGMVSKGDAEFDGKTNVSGSLVIKGTLMPDEESTGGTSDGYIQTISGGVNIKVVKGVIVSITDSDGNELLN